VSVFVALGIRHAPYCHVACLAVPYFPHYRMNGTILEREKKKHWTKDARFDFLYNFCLKHFSF
jgi:hypothetical protein